MYLNKENGSFQSSGEGQSKTTHTKGNLLAGELNNLTR